MIKTECSDKIDQEFLEELFKLYKRYDRYVSSCCMVGVNRGLNSAIAFDDEGEEVIGIEALKIRYNK